MDFLVESFKWLELILLMANAFPSPEKLFLISYNRFQPRALKSLLLCKSTAKRNYSSANIWDVSLIAQFCLSNDDKYKYQEITLKCQQNR